MEELFASLVTKNVIKINIMEDFTKLDRKYDDTLFRPAGMGVRLSTTPQDASTEKGASSTAPNKGGLGSSNPNSGGLVAEAAVKSEGHLSDIWINNFIKSVHWKPRSVGFYINGQTGYAEFANIYVSGSINALTGVIGGFTLTATDLTATSGGNTTIFSSGPVAFTAGPTGAPTVTITQAGVVTASNTLISGGTMAGFYVYPTYMSSTAAGNTSKVAAEATFLSAGPTGAPTFKVGRDGSFEVKDPTIVGKLEMAGNDFLNLPAMTDTVAESLPGARNGSVYFRTNKQDIRVFATGAWKSLMFIPDEIKKFESVYLVDSPYVFSFGEHTVLDISILSEFVSLDLVMCPEVTENVTVTDVPDIQFPAPHSISQETFISGDEVITIYNGYDSAIFITYDSTGSPWGGSSGPSDTGPIVDSFTDIEADFHIIFYSQNGADTCSSGGGDYDTCKVSTYVIEAMTIFWGAQFSQDVSVTENISLTII